MTRKQVRHLIQSAGDAVSIQNEIRRQVSGRRGSQGRQGDSVGARTKRVVGRRNVMEDYQGPAIRKTGDKRVTVDHPLGLLGLKNTDGSSVFKIVKRKKTRKNRGKKKSRKK